MKVSSSMIQPETILGHKAPVTAIAFSPDGTTLISGDTERRIIIQTPEAPAIEIDLSSEAAKVRTTERMREICFSSDGAQFYVSASDRLRAFWTETGEETWSYRPPRFFGFLIVSPLRLGVSNANQVAVCFDNATIGVWSAFGDKHALWRDSEAPNWIGWLQDGVRIVGSDSFHVGLWDTGLRTKIARWTSEDRIYNLAVHPTEDTLVIRTLHGHRVMNAETGETLGAFEAALGLPLVAFRPHYKLIAIVGENAVSIVNYSGEQQAEFPLLDLSPKTLAWSPDGKKLGVGCSDGSIKVFELD